MLNSFFDHINYQELSPLMLAYVGDAVYELMIRQYLLTMGPIKMQDIHREAVRYVKAGAQAKALHALRKTLNSTEHDIVRKGRNARTGHLPKNANVIDYRYSTGLESLIGYLYLEGEKERLHEVMKIICRVIEDDEDIGE
ncbi:MAG: ribonuclease III [Clostridiales bacterium]|nr:ribonuclease III [Clostridiales bacterium]MCF8023642.1 ribonuclease III [Clostridiales bacterium]